MLSRTPCNSLEDTPWHPRGYSQDTRPSVTRRSVTFKQAAHSYHGNAGRVCLDSPNGAMPVCVHDCARIVEREVSRRFLDLHQSN
eukprot:scaffold115598_cov60-Phaeocystis_antarctica.AAC.6